MGKWSTIEFYRNQLFVSKIPLAKADLSGQTVMVIGANINVGFEVAKHFAAMGPEKLIPGCRNGSFRFFDLSYSRRELVVRVCV